MIIARIARIACIACIDHSARALWLSAAFVIAGCTHKAPAPGPVVSGPDKAAPAKTGPDNAKEDELTRMLQPDTPFGPPGTTAKTEAPPAGAAAALERPITIAGTAKNAALGAVVVDDRGEAWFIDKLPEWKGADLNRRVVVSGVVRERKLAPDPVVDKDGAVSHGMMGTARVIVRAAWKRAD